MQPLSMPSGAVAPSSTTAQLGAADRAVLVDVTGSTGFGGVGDLHCLLRDGELVVERDHVACDDGEHYLDRVILCVVGGADKISDGSSLRKLKGEFSGPVGMRSAISSRIRARR